MGMPWNWNVNAGRFLFFAALRCILLCLLPAENKMWMCYYISSKSIPAAAWEACRWRALPSLWLIFISIMLVNKQIFRNDLYALRNYAPKILKYAFLFSMFWLLHKRVTARMWLPFYSNGPQKCEHYINCIVFCYELVYTLNIPFHYISR